MLLQGIKIPFIIAGLCLLFFSDIEKDVFIFGAIFGIITFSFFIKIDDIIEEIEKY